MVIDFNSPNGPNGAGRSNQTTGAAGKREAGAVNNTAGQQPAPQSSQTESTSSVSLSAQAQQLQAIEEKLRDLPEVDNERVSQIKQAIADGSYQVDSSRIADKLLSLDS